MTPREILIAFDLEDPRPEQEAIAQYLAECTLVEMAVVSLDECRINTVEKVIDYLDKARNKKTR